jgi:hypothetical protein
MQSQNILRQSDNAEEQLSLSVNPRPPVEMESSAGGLKKCFKCQQEKRRCEFYAHPMMGDGLLGKCKVCTKLDVAERIERKKLEPEWMRQERKRCRDKQERRREAGLDKRQYPEIQKRWHENNKHKSKAQHLARHAMKKNVIPRQTNCNRCGVSGVRLEMHHADYSKPLEVEWLCTKCHGKTRWKDIQT